MKNIPAFLIAALSLIPTLASAQTGDPLMDDVQACRGTADRNWCISEVVVRRCASADRGCIYRVLNMATEMSRSEAAVGTGGSGPVVVVPGGDTGAGSSPDSITPGIVGVTPVTFVYLYTSSDCYGPPVQTLSTISGSGVCRNPGLRRIHVNGVRIGSTRSACAPFVGNAADACASFVPSF